MRLNPPAGRMPAGPRPANPWSRPGRRILKRGLDVSVSLILAASLWPMIAFLAALVRLTMGSPVIFRQLRPGRDGRPFPIRKFRTMDFACSSRGPLLPDDRRLTSFGRILRRTSLDELPELWNVLKGEMSLVGPRPLLLEYLDRYNKEQDRRHWIRPGITGWAQVNGRNDTTWEERFRLDLWYVDHGTVWLDMKVLALTVGRVLFGRGVSPPGRVTMEPFMGNTKERPS